MKKTIRIMFVDDEDKIRKLLKVCINWEDLGFEITADASGTSQALELLSTEKPDVIITDIEMPFINGLEFASMVMEEYPHIKIVILTAHNDFSYAQQGVELGIFAFLLKPIRRNELHQKMLELRNTLWEEQRHICEHELLQQKLQENRLVIIQNFLSNLLINQVSSHTLVDTLAYYQIPLHTNTGYYNTLLIIPQRNVDIEKNIMQHIQCKELINTKLKRMTGVLLLSDFQQNLVLITENPKINLCTYASLFSSLIQEQLDISVYWGIGTAVSSLEKLHQSYRQAFQNAQIAHYSHNNSILGATRQEGNNTGLQDLLDQIYNELPLYLKVPMQTKAMELVKNVYFQLEQWDTSNLSDVMILSLSIVNLILTILSDNGIPYDEIYYTQHLPYSHILKLTHPYEMKNYVLQLIDFTMHQLENYNNTKGNKLIHTIIQYMEEHLQDSTLGLKKVSEIYYINPSYLSRTFKEVMGINFIDYLSNLRLEKSKKLLTGTELRIYEIAESVGITDPNYFSKFFKKNTSLSPAQYKEKYTKKEEVTT